MWARKQILIFSSGVLLTATFLWPIVGFVQGHSNAHDLGRQRPDWRLVKIAEQFRPDWIPHHGHMSSAPAFRSFGSEMVCLKKLEGREMTKSYGVVTISDTLVGSLWLRKNSIVEPFEINTIHKLFPLSFGAINGCIEGSIAAPFCKMLLRDGMRGQYELARPKIEKQLQKRINEVEAMACEIIAPGQAFRRQE